MSDQNELVCVLNYELAIDIPEKLSFEEIRLALTKYINDLIQNNFQKLVALLYKIDVSEIKLKAMLEENIAVDSGALIADLIIERQLQKIESRLKSRDSNNNISNEERW